MKKSVLSLVALSVLFTANSSGIATERVYLSGTGPSDTKTWDFHCSEGMNSGKWSKIEVPSQWEQQGFGAYTYGRFYLDKNAKPSSEVGTYRHAFEVPKEWKGQKVKIVFEGSMTDTDVKVNGKSAGKVHQGGFTEFSYDISDLLKYGSDSNMLEVKVSKESANPSVNAAERRADWWLFGGIYRPVYLEVMPKMHIDRVALDARADGRLASTLFAEGLKKGSTVEVEVKSVSDGLSLREFIARDVNHPSVILWSNGNEGGWNKALDGMFALLDPQGRHVVHPWSDFNGIDTHHYPSYQTGPGKLGNGWKVFMPTEFLHSRYDKGGGAGLEDFWTMYRRNPMFAGGFIWAFVDEAIARTDKDGWLDSDGSNGCDGVVGPYREKEGSFYTIKDVWAPIQFAPLNITPSFDGTMLVTNEFLFTNFDECSMKWRTYSVSSPESGGAKTMMASGDVALPSIEPNETGRARFMLPDDFFEADILEVEMFDQTGRSVVTRTWPVKFASDYLAFYTDDIDSSNVRFEESEDIVTLVSPKVSVSFDRHSGMITDIDSGGKKVAFGNGPIAVGMKAKAKGSTVYQDNDNAVFIVKYEGGIDSIVWRMNGEGVLTMDAVMLNHAGGKIDGEPVYSDKIGDIGITFSYPESEVKGMTWLGAGPYRVWKNRQRGANFGLWHKDYNNTITGNSFENLVYPEFKGYHGSLYWAILEGANTDITVSSATDGIFLRMFTPQEPDGIKGEDKMQPFPEGDISFLIDINAMRSFKPIAEHGPLSQPTKVRIKPGDEGVDLSLRFRF
ncbi:MAG: hypothetical protein K2N35_12260 [Muribaculaceae bacterium]|nr:hypothetical protein [Muribaculaceae bacterium]